MNKTQKAMHFNTLQRLAESPISDAQLGRKVRNFFFTPVRRVGRKATERVRIILRLNPEDYL